MSLRQRFDHRLILIPFLDCWLIDLSADKLGYCRMKDDKGKDRPAKRRYRAEGRIV